MSGRISSQGSVIMISDPSAVIPPLAITAGTKAKPATITITGTAPPVGTIVVPTGTGWNSIDGRPFMVSVVATQVITLEDSNTINEVAAINVTAGKISTRAWLELCRSTFNINNPAGATIDVTTLCDEAHRIVSGLPGIATWTAAGFYDAGDTAMFIARDAYRSGQSLEFEVIFRDGTGVAFRGTVTTFDLTMGINAAVTNSIGGNVDGVISFFKTNPVGFIPLMDGLPMPEMMTPPLAETPAPAPVA